jgi:alkanesulfonate monooxygenase
MSLQLHWFLPTHGDGRDVAKSAAGEPAAARAVRREPELGYLSQVALAADRFGFAGMLTPAGMFCEDPWLVASALAPMTTRVKFMVAMRPGLTSPVLTAQMAATFQRLSAGRLLVNIVSGGDPDEQRRYGDWLDHDQRYERTEEFLDVLRRASEGRPFDFEGVHYRISKGLLTRPHPIRPPIFLGGSSDSAMRAAARYADVFLAWGEPPAAIAELVKQTRRLAESHGRELGFGSRFHVISRDTSAEAWQVAHGLLEGMDQARIDAAQKRFLRSESEGQRRMGAMHGGRTDALEVYPNVWAGYALVRPGAGAALVGSHAEVAERIEEYHALGLDHLILSGQPHLEELYSLGEGVLPRLRHLLAEPA